MFKRIWAISSDNINVNMPRFSDCWRCAEKPAAVVCLLCNVANYCSKSCQEDDKARHTNAECNPASVLKICSCCRKTGSSLRICTGCYRDFYCDVSCQQKHRKEHKHDCKCITEKIESLSGKLQGYFFANTSRVCLGHYYWGNIPAYDYINLSENEGVDYDLAMKILVLGVGDLRNVVITCASLPKSYTSDIKFTLNDSNSCVLARLVLLLYMMIKCDSSVDKIVTEIWYSTKLSRMTYNYLCKSLEGLLAMKSREEFVFATAELVRLSDNHLEELQKVWKQWLALKVENTSEIQEQRTKAIESDSGSFFGKISYFHCIPQEHVPSAKKYMEDGVFQRSKEPTVFENPTLTGPSIIARDTSYTYCCPTSVLPFCGWDYIEIKRFKHDNCLITMFGRYIECQLRRFMEKLSSRQVSFEIVLGCCMGLDESIDKERRYDRILTSNLMDYILLPDLLRVYSKKLNKDNPLATLITESQNWTNFCPGATVSDGSSMLSQMASLIKILQQDMKNQALDLLDYSCGTTFQEYVDNSEEFQDYLRALFHVYHKRQQTGTRRSPNLPRLKELGNEFHLRMRDIFRNENRIVFFKMAINRRRVTMLSGLERSIEWVTNNKND